MNPLPGQGPGRFIGTVFGFVFFGIGLTVLGFLWGTPFNEFGAPPLVFRIFGSFIALAFVAVGGSTAYAAIKGNPLSNAVHKHLDQAMNSTPAPQSDGYACDSCGAKLGGDAEVSPHGDVKCAHCGRWFNVHGR